MAAAAVMVGTLPAVTLAQIVPTPGTSTRVIQTQNGLAIPKFTELVFRGAAR
jgi:filamentous hemagglutinin